MISHSPLFAAATISDQVKYYRAYDPLLLDTELEALSLPLPLWILAPADSCTFVVVVGFFIGLNPLL